MACNNTFINQKIQLLKPLLLIIFSHQKFSAKIDNIETLIYFTNIFLQLNDFCVGKILYITHFTLHLCL